jgi:hypothetical protein
MIKAPGRMYEVTGDTAILDRMKSCEVRVKDFNVSYAGVPR